MAEATISKDASAPTIDVTTPTAGYTAGEVIQLTDGRASFVLGLVDLVSGDPASLLHAGQVTLDKTASIVILEGAPLYWDRSAGTVTPLKALAGGDFFVGSAVADAASADTTIVVDLNERPNYTIDIMRDPTNSVAVGDAAVTMGPGFAKLNMLATSEAEKIDIMSLHSVPVVSGSAIPFIVEGRAMIFDTPSGAATDFNIGLANDTHATTAESITEYLFLHFDNALDIFAGSTDGTTTVAITTNTTVDAVEGTYFDFAFDCRDLEDVQVYINGVLVLGSTVFDISEATGPLKLMVHLEKTTGTEIGELRVSKFALRATDLAS